MVNDMINVEEIEIKALPRRRDDRRRLSFTAFPNNCRKMIRRKNDMKVEYHDLFGKN